MYRYLSKRGYVKLEPEVGDRPIKITHKSYENYDKDEINICLNCTYKECKPDGCKKILDYELKRGICNE